MMLNLEILSILATTLLAIAVMVIYLGTKISNIHKTLEQNQNNPQLLQFKTQLDALSANLHALSQLIETKLNHWSTTLEDRMFRMQADSSDKLELIRKTVDEKLHETLEARLGETFKIVSERLEQVHRSIGEMQTLATGVGDLKRILSNVKTRGMWGEVQLEAILEQMMSSHQYEKNACVRKDSMEKVEFAVKLPSKEDESNILLPIDAKFPLDIYQKLQAAQDNTDITMIEICSKELEQAIKKQAKLICEKYINVPTTTEFAIMFLPIEGLYAEVLRIPGLSEFVQQNYRIVITGPTTLSAILSSLQMGYRTIAIQKRSSEVWSLLSQVRKEFIKFSDLLSKTKLKLDQASRVIGEAESKTKTIQKRLKNIEIDQDDLSINDNILPTNLKSDENL
jgi:DNA recombination protein RmuC